MRLLFSILLLLFFSSAFAKVYKVGANEEYKTIKKAMEAAKNGDTILVKKGHYKEGNINVTKSLTFIGEGRPVLDGEMKYEIMSFRANHIILKGFKLINSGKNEFKNIGAIRLYDSKFTTIQDNIFQNNYFGVYIQRGFRCLIKNNRFISNRTTNQEQSGNGIHAWQCDEIWIKNNYISGYKDGIYLERVRSSFIYKNYSYKNMRYGLHFMFSHNNVYKGNTFKNNSAGVAVMYTKNVDMEYNIFEDNWGDAAYGLLLKEIQYSKIKNNIFRSNTTAVLVDGATEMEIERNTFVNNGWGLKINANSRDSKLFYNNFINNTFDISTNGSTMMNEFKYNYWDKYEGYDLNKDGIGDVPFYPLSLYSVLTEKNPSVMLLYKTFFVDLLEKTEKIVPSLTPENFVDKEPMMKKNTRK
ncbi:MAG: nitrous oxide reductase family maturation protein NosD [Bergeyella cardium]|uniref:nitrous oxide reductase family maturation protein NosD n=1 Tax=Bergeyella cardium TaxID=1585976 RepID=UPI000EA3D0F7|nr:nitrous oxide reductase family maturation protein NosD [Bergeyella cardium]